MEHEDDMKELLARARRTETRLSSLAQAMGVEMVNSDPAFQVDRATDTNKYDLITSVHKHFSVRQLIKFMRSADIKEAEVLHAEGERFTIELD